MTGNMIDTNEHIERVLLIGTACSVVEKEEIDEHLTELRLLIKTLGFKTVETLEINLKKINPSTYIGKGKIGEIQNLISYFDIDQVIFDNDLLPTQSRNLEKQLDVEVLDRSGVILEIFAQHARTKEAKTQIELATLEYLLPRLTRRWTHLERQIGGIGVRGGPGEKQIEIDRRLIRTRIGKLKKELKKIKKIREVQSKNRSDQFKVALVGYTNAGKSTIMNVITNSDVLVENKLFATLDTTVRKCVLDNFHQVLLSDTVGFIRKLPPNLVASFRTTLKEVEDADLLLKVVDISSPFCFKQLETVDKFLLELGLVDTPSIVVFNKIDKRDMAVLKQAKRDHPDAVFMSALKKLRVENLKEIILEVIADNEVEIKLKIPVSDFQTLVTLRNNTFFKQENYIEDMVHIELISDKKVWEKLRKLLPSIVGSYFVTGQVDLQK